MVQWLPYTRFAEVTVNSNFAGTSAAMDSGKVQRINYDGHYYSFNIRYPSLTYKQAKEISAFLTKHGGPLNSFNLRVPELALDSMGSHTTILNDIIETYGDSEVWTAFPYVTGVDLLTNTITYEVALDADDYATRGYDLNNFFAEGDYVSFSNHNKAYQIIDNFSSTPLTYTGVQIDNAGYYIHYWYQGQFKVGPNIVLTDLDQWDINDGVTLNVRNTNFRVFLTDSVVSYTASTSNDTSMTLNVREEI